MKIINKKMPRSLITEKMKIKHKNTAAPNDDKSSKFFPILLEDRDKLEL